MNKKPIPEEYQGFFTFIVWFFSAGIALVPLSAINQFLSDLNRAFIISNNLTFTATEATLSLILSIAQTAVALFFINKSQPRKLGILMPRGMGDSATAHFLSFL